MKAPAVAVAAASEFQARRWVPLREISGLHGVTRTLTLDGLEFMPIDGRMSDLEITAQVVEDLKRCALKPARLGLSDDGASDCRRRIIELIALRRPKSIVHPALLLPRV